LAKEARMLALDSPRWATLRSSPGFNGELSARLIRAVRNGDHIEFAELYHQACHQFGVGEVAYAIVPHVIAIASGLPLRERMWPLVIAGTVAAVRAGWPQTTPPVPEDLWPDYEHANVLAMEMATEALRNRSQWSRAEVLELLAVVAGLHGSTDLAMHLFLLGGTDELSCPSCGEPIRFGERGRSEPFAPADQPRD
jgi:hypothetical protein